MTKEMDRQLTKEEKRKLNERAVDLMIQTLGLEHPSVIWFCREIEKNPYIDVTERTKLIVKAFEGVFEDEDEE